MTERERAMLATLAIRAEKYYLAASKLTPLLDRDSRAAMWVLVTIYHRLLARIAERKMEVFGERIALSTAEKLAVLVSVELQWPHGTAWQNEARLRPAPPGSGCPAHGRRRGGRGRGRAGRGRGAGGRRRVVTLLERRGFIGGRAYSYPHPSLGETIDSQHSCSAAARTSSI